MALSGSQQTVLKPYGWPGQPYGSFSGKVEAAAEAVYPVILTLHDRDLTLTLLDRDLALSLDDRDLTLTLRERGK